MQTAESDFYTAMAKAKYWLGIFLRAGERTDWDNYHDAWMQGAYSAGVKSADQRHNPFEVDSKYRKAWRAGFDIGRRVDFAYERVVELESRVFQLMAISCAVEEWMGGRITEKDLKETAAKVLSEWDDSALSNER